MHGMAGRKRRSSNALAAPSAHSFNALGRPWRVDFSKQARSVNMFTRRFWLFFRWVCVLPAAIVVGTAADYIVGLLAMALRAASLSAFDTWRWLFGLGYVPRDAAVVFAAAMVAPRYQVTTALVLAVGEIGLALTAHVLRPSTVGFTNYAHFAAES